MKQIKNTNKMNPTKLTILSLLMLIVMSVSVWGASCGDCIGCNAACVCGDTVSGNYTMSGDLTGCTGNGLVIGASGITLDCNGNYIVGVGGSTNYGISRSSFWSGVTIKNCNINNFNSGIRTSGSNGNWNINNNHFTNNTHGVYVVSNVNWSIHDNNFINNTKGVVLLNSVTSESNIFDNIYNGTATAIEFTTGSNGNKFFNNVIDNSNGITVWLRRGANNTQIYNNTIYTAYNAFSVTSNNNTIRDNIVYNFSHHCYDGLVSHSDNLPNHNNSFYNNYCYSDGLSSVNGVYIENSSDGKIYNNSFILNNPDSTGLILAFNSYNNHIYNNIIDVDLYAFRNNIVDISHNYLTKYENNTHLNSNRVRIPNNSNSTYINSFPITLEIAATTQFGLECPTNSQFYTGSSGESWQFDGCDAGACATESCVFPKDTLEINTNTTIFKGKYYINDKDGNVGIFKTTGDNIVLNLNDAIIEGDGTGTGINANFKHNNIVLNGTLTNYNIISYQSHARNWVHNYVNYTKANSRCMTLSNANFTTINNSIISTMDTTGSQGILIQSTSNNSNYIRILNSQILNSHYGIRQDYHDTMTITNLLIDNNYFKDNFYNVLTRNSSLYANITNNYVVNSGWNGFEYGGSHGYVANNIFELIANHHGIQINPPLIIGGVPNMGNNTIYNNTFLSITDSDETCIFITNSPNNFIINNTCHNGAIRNYVYDGWKNVSGINSNNLFSGNILLNYTGAGEAVVCGSPNSTFINNYFYGESIYDLHISRFSVNNTNCRFINNTFSTNSVKYFVPIPYINATVNYYIQDDEEITFLGNAPSYSTKFKWLGSGDKVLTVTNTTVNATLSGLNSVHHTTPEVGKLAGTPNFIDHTGTIEKTIASGERMFILNYEDANSVRITSLPPTITDITYGYIYGYYLFSRVGTGDAVLNITGQKGTGGFVQYSTDGFVYFDFTTDNTYTVSDTQTYYFRTSDLTAAQVTCERDVGDWVTGISEVASMFGLLMLALIISFLLGKTTNAGMTFKGIRLEEMFVIITIPIMVMLIIIILNAMKGVC